jgi:chromosome segregation ATPase
MDMTIVLGAALAIAVVILSAVFALSRRVDRLTEALMDLRQLHVSLQETQTDLAHVVRQFESVARALIPLEALQREVEGSDVRRSELIDALGEISDELDDAGQGALALPAISAGLNELQRATEGYHLRMDKMQAAVAALARAHSEQQQMHKLLKALGPRIEELQQMSASMPTIKAQQMQIQSAIADWRSRFDAAAKELDDFMAVEWKSTARIATDEVAKTS